MHWGRKFRSCIPRHQALVVALLSLWLWDSPPLASTRTETAPLFPQGLTLQIPPPQTVNEEEVLRLTIPVKGGRPGTRVFVEGLPPGAVWHEPSRTLTFQPEGPPP